MENYYSDFLAGLLSMTDPGSGELIYGPTRQAEARATASDAESGKLRSLLGGKGKLPKGHGTPRGSYALAKLLNTPAWIWICR
jgi:hypothetical protein